MKAIKNIMIALSGIALLASCDMDTGSSGI